MPKNPKVMENRLCKETEKGSLKLSTFTEVDLAEYFQRILVYELTRKKSIL